MSYSSEPGHWCDQCGQDNVPLTRLGYGFLCASCFAQPLVVA